MGRQTGFFATDLDMFALCSEAARLDLVAVPAVLAPTSAPVRHAPTECASPRQYADWFALTASKTLDHELIYQGDVSSDTRYLSCTRSPIVEVRYAYVGRSGMEDGRIYVAQQSGWPGRDRTLVAYEHLRRWIRKAWTPAHRLPLGPLRKSEIFLYVGPDAAGRARSDELRLFSMGYGYRVVDG
jgi:hypothetical protein